MLNYNDYQMIRNLQKSSPEIYDLIKRIIDYSLESASHACHDLKNHTALISGYCQLLALTEPEISRNQYISKIEQSVANQLALFDEIAAFRYSFKSDVLTSCDIITLLRNAINKVSPSIRLFPDSPDTLFYNCNPEHMERAFEAILTNAVEAAPAKNMQVAVYVNIHGNNIELIFKDNGPGFSPEMLPKACNPFETDKKNHTGLGLAIASSVILKHKGDLQIANTPDGSQVTINLPT